MGKRSKFDKLVCVDLEATCWMPRSSQPENEVSEIIEIGVCFLDLKTYKVSNKTSYIVKPRNSKISPFCTELTTLTQEDVNRGMLFSDACNKMKKDFGTQNRIWASWGDYDKTAFEKNCKLYNVPCPFSISHINAKNIFSIHHGISKGLGLQKALNYSGLEFVGTHHRGHDDAYNVARILGKMWRK